MESSATQPRSPVIAAFAPGPAAREPIDFGLAASRITGAPLVIVAVEHGASDDDAGGERARLREELVSRGVNEPDIRVYDDDSAARGLARAMDELNPALIVLGASRRGAPKLLGTTAQHVIAASACPVAIVPLGYERPSEGVQMVGAAYAPTDEGREALHAAVALARAAGVRVRAITVLDPGHAADQSHGLMAEAHHEVNPAEGKSARGRLDVEEELRAELSGSGDVEIDVLVNDPAEGLLAASRHVDLLVMGSRGLGPKRAVLLGSVSRKVIAAAACPVLVLPRGVQSNSPSRVVSA